jgi:uncharacterized protein (DUF433 family)
MARGVLRRRSGASMPFGKELAEDYDLTPEQIEEAVLYERAA